MKQTKNTPIPRFRTAFALSLILQAGATVLAQEDDEEVFELSPFVVDSSDDVGYRAENTLAGSRLATKVSDLAASISVVTAQQLEDTASIDINDVFRYESNTEGSGTYTPAVQSLRNDGVVDVNAGFTHGANGATQSNAIANRVRGIGSPGSSTNFYVSNPQVPFDSYNVQSIEISRGPNSMLFGMGSPAGIVNQTTAQAVLDVDRNSFSTRFDDRGSSRFSFNFNRGLIDGKLAVYGAFLVDNQRFERKPSYDDTKRAYGAITYRPFEKTVLRASIESFNNDHRRPNTLTPRDGVSEWRAGGSWGFNPATGMLTSASGETMGPIAQRDSSPRMDQTRAYIESLPGYDASNWNEERTQYNGVNIFGSSAVTNTGSVMYAPGLGFPNSSRPKMQLVDGQLASYQYYGGNNYRIGYGTEANPTGNAPTYFSGNGAVYAHSPEAAAAYDVNYSESGFFTQAGNGVSGYRYPGVTDQSIYDWERINILQMNFGAKDNVTYNVEFEQQIVPNLNFSAGFFRQDYDSTINYTVSQLNVATLFVDTNTHLADGTPNPMFGQPFVKDFDPDRFITDERNDNYRAMLAWTPDFTKSDGWVRWLGRHQVLGFLSQNKVETEFKRQRWFITDSDEGSAGAVFLTRNPNPNLDGTPTGYSGENRSVQRNWYLSAPNSSPDGAVTQASGTWDNSMVTADMRYFNFDANSWDGLSYTTGFVNHSAHTGRTERVVDSQNFGITSHLWNDRIVTTFGFRTDDYKARASTSGAITDTDGNVILPAMTNQERWVDGVLNYDALIQRLRPWEEISGDTKTTGGVIRPFKNWDGIDNEFLRSLGFSYNKSDNFNPPSGTQVDAFGNFLPDPGGEGEDWGVQFSLFEGKLFARLNWFESSNQDERVNPGTTLSRINSNIDTSLFREWAETIAKINMGIDPTISAEWDQELSPAEQDALEADVSKIWGQDYNYYRDLPGTISATQDAIAEGTELSITYNPIPNWSIKLTGGEQETIYSNVLREYDEWLAVRQPQWANATATDYLLPEYQHLNEYETEGGRLVRLGTFLNDAYGYAGSAVNIDDANGITSAQAVFDRDVRPQVVVAKELEGSVSPGQRKYRAAFITNYKFQDGGFKGFGVGGSVRWEDKSAVGYYGKPNPDIPGSTNLALIDLTRPIYDEANTYTDLWCSYETYLNDGDRRLKFQLNIVNAFENGGLQEVGYNLDGTANAYRIVDPRQFIGTVTVDF